MVVLRMIRCAELWEWIYLLVLIALVLTCAFYTSLHLPRMLVAFLLTPTIIMAVGAFFVFDNIRRRADQPWL